jgi:hypothetical protein
MKPPSDVAGQPNGNIDTTLLTPIGPGLARLHHTVARGWFAMRAAAFEAGGWVLHYTSVADTYRTYAVQQAVFVERYKPVLKQVYDVTASANRKLWIGAIDHGYDSIYWIKKSNNLATAATPGTSPHGLGCAIDGAFPGVNVPWTPALPWLQVNAAKYGFAWSLQSEPWHVQWTMGDVIPQAVLDFEAPPEPPPIPHPDPDPPEEDDMPAAPAVYIPADKDGVNWGYTDATEWFVVFPGGITVSATGADVAYAERTQLQQLGAVQPRIGVTSADWHQRLAKRARAAEA